MASTSYGNISNNYVFDVFINHRGPDCKKTLAKYLYDRLIKEGLRVFLDVNELQEGEEITPQIQSAIRTASVHIAIFSPRYAESNWCLDELLLMLLLMFESGSTILPVFYGVEPSDLRWVTQGETGVYGQALKTLKNKRKFDSQPRYDSDNIQNWKDALSVVADIKGFDIKTCNGDEQQLLQQVVEGVLKKVKRPLHVSRYPTGLDEKVKEFEGTVLLEQQSRETRVIGIVGLGGAGKTTLAKEIFNRRRSNYKQSCFLFDVREKVARNSLESVQSMLLKDLIHWDAQISSTDSGIEMLRSKLKSSHAFIVLDDVDHVQQVDALLLPVKDVLHQGSLILVTSRNRDVLANSGIVESSIFKLRGLDRDHSRELFCRHAFDQPYPLTEFEQVVRDFVDACAGLPLSLKVLGALLRGKDLNYATAQFRKLSKTLHTDIRSRLQISYDGLDAEEKHIFLDIVCFFIGEDRDTAIRIWDGTEWGGWLGLRNLERRCLVEVDDKNCIRMHDHLRDLGRHIAMYEPPERTARLSCPIHDLRYLSDKSLVRGISTVHSQGCERDQPSFKTLEEFADSGFRFRNYVRGLQLLRAQGYFVESEFMESIFSVAKSLIWLCWVDFPYSCLPSCITLKNLRVLRIEGRKLETLWLDESQAPEQLRELYIMADSVKVPKSISKMTHLEKIALVGNGLHVTFLDELCRLKSLKHLELGLDDPSYGGRWPKITFMSDSDSSNCFEMESLPDSFGSLTKLQSIAFFKFSNLQMLPESFGNLTKLTNFELSGCSSLRMLPESFGNLRKLTNIELSGCSSLRMLPYSLGNLINLTNINLYRCSGLQMLPDSFGNLTNLKQISLRGCSSLQMLPDSFGNLTNLRDISLGGCSSLQMLPDSFGNLTNLQFIDLFECSSLQMLPDSFGNLTNLQSINLSECSSLQMLPDSLGNLTNLHYIDLSKCSSVKMLPDSIGKLVNLDSINLSECSSLQMLPDSFGNLKNLRHIELFNCSSLQRLPNSFGNLIQLE